MFVYTFKILLAKELIQLAMSSINSMNVRRDEKKDKKKKKKKNENPFSGISLCVIGRSGTGKTALMAKLATTTRAANDQRPVIIRFCGTSKGSVNGLALVQSLCHQIQLVLQLSPYYEKAVLMLHSLLNEHAIVLFIDRLVHTLLNTLFNQLYQLALLVCQRNIFITHSLNIPSQHNLSTHSVSPPSKPTIYTHLFNTVLISFVMRI